MISRIKRRIDRWILAYIDYAVSRRRAIQTCDVKGHVLFLDVESEIESFRAKTYATKEPETLEWIERHFRPGDVMYDIGANIGLYSLYAAKHLSSRLKVYAFEPEALNHAKLNRNVYLNGLSGVVIPCCTAIAGKTGFAMFHLHPNIMNPERIGEGPIAGSALHAFGEPVDHEGKSFRPVHQQGMMGVSIDELTGIFGLDFPNHIKIDVDGIEEQIIEGASTTLNDPRLRSVLVEISAARGGNDPILRRLTDAGFRQVTDFAEHSSQQLVGTPYEDSVNTVFVRD